MGRLSTTECTYLPTYLAGVLGCVRGPLAPSHSWPRVRGVGVCVWARVSAAPRHSWLGCWAVCVLRLHPATPRLGCAVWVCMFGLGFWLRPATPGWAVGLCVCSACTQPLLARVLGVGVCVLGSIFGCAPPLLAGVLGCVCAPLAPSHSWPRVRGVGVCVWARDSAAPRHSWLGCWDVCVLRLHPATPGHGCAVWVCVFRLGFRLRPATPGWGVGLCACSACTQPLLATGARCGCVSLGLGFGCAPPLLAGVLGCVCAPLAPRCFLVLSMGAPGCCSSSVVLCSCLALSVCRAPSRVVGCGSFGWRVCVTVLGVVARMVSVVRLVLWCLDAPSDVAGWARRNTPVPVGRGAGAAPCGELVAPRMPRVGLWRTGVPGSVAALPYVLIWIRYFTQWFYPV